MIHNWGIKQKLTFLVLIGAGTILFAVITYSYFFADRLLEKELQEKAKHLAEATSRRIGLVNSAVERTVKGMAISLELNPPSSKEDIYRLLSRFLLETQEVCGAAVAFNPVHVDPRLSTHVPYVFKKGEALEYDDLIKDDYSYDIQDWYTLPKELNKVVWSEPYYDEGGGNALMVTCSSPFHMPDQPNMVAGVVTSDVSLEWLGGLLRSLPLGKSGYAFLISRNGRFISHPVKELIMNETIFSVAERRNNPALRELGRRMVQGQAGYLPYKSETTGKPYWMVYIPVQFAGWTLAALFPEEELKEKITALQKREAAIAALGFFGLWLIILRISRSIAQPISKLDEAATTLAGGNLDAPLPNAAGRDEVARLTRSFSTMRDELKIYMERLKETVAAKERIESELRIARDIQMSLVPRTFPPSPDREDIELYAVMDPAREVGGDFYDFFSLDNDHFFIAIGDVSGKGIAAALFMAVTRSFLRSMMREVRNPALALARLNNELSKDNEACMFVTLFCALVHIPSGECIFASAGHNPPMFLPKGGKPVTLSMPTGAAAGVMENVVYGEGRIVLEREDTLFLYTDGVTEAMSSSEEMFGEERTSRCLEAFNGGSCADLLKKMRNSIREFAGSEEQSDDITLLALRRIDPWNGRV